MAETRFHALLKVQIEIAIQAMADSLTTGGSIDYANYRDGVGYIRGLRDALKACAEIEKDYQ